MACERGHVYAIQCHGRGDSMPFPCKQSTEGCKGAITHSVLPNDDMLFHLCLLSYETDDEDAT